MTCPHRCFEQEVGEDNLQSPLTWIFLRSGMAFRGKFVLEMGRKGEEHISTTIRKSPTHAMTCPWAWQMQQAPTSTTAKLSLARLNPEGTNPTAIPARNNCAWRSHSTHCTWALLLRQSDPTSNFITLVQPQNFPIVSAPPFLTFTVSKFFLYSITP